MQLLKGAYSYIDGGDDTEDCTMAHHCLPCQLFRDRVRGWKTRSVRRWISWQPMKDFRYRQLHDQTWS